VAERRLELTGEDALTEEEARVLLCGGAWDGFTEEELDHYNAARRKLARARERSNRLRLVEDGGGPPPVLSPLHRHYLQICARNEGRPTHIFRRERRIAEDLAVLGLVEIGPLGATVTHEGKRAA
jgi:hypothetical protein